MRLKALFVLVLLVCLLPGRALAHHGGAEHNYNVTVTFSWDNGEQYDRWWCPTCYPDPLGDVRVGLERTPFSYEDITSPALLLWVYNNLSLTDSTSIQANIVDNDVGSSDRMLKNKYGHAPTTCDQRVIHSSLTDTHGAQGTVSVNFKFECLDYDDVVDVPDEANDALPSDAVCSASGNTLLELDDNQIKAEDYNFTLRGLEFDPSIQSEIDTLIPVELQVAASNYYIVQHEAGGDGSQDYGDIVYDTICASDACTPYGTIRFIAHIGHHGLLFYDPGTTISGLTSGVDDYVRAVIPYHPGFTLSQTLFEAYNNGDLNTTDPIEIQQFSANPIKPHLIK